MRRLASEDLKIGDRFRSKIDESIRIHDKLLLILSANSIESSWVEDEVESALDRERNEGRSILFPVKIDDAVSTTNVAWARHLRQKRHIGDFRGWENSLQYSHTLERLLRDLNTEAPPI